MRKKFTFIFMLSACLQGGPLYISQADDVEHIPLPHAQHALKAHIDPITGHFTRSPQPDEHTVSASSALSRLTIQQGHQFKSIRLPHGAVMINLEQYYRPNRQPETPAATP